MAWLVVQGPQKQATGGPCENESEGRGGGEMLLFLLLVASVDEWPPRRWALRQFMFVVCVSPTRNATLLLLAITNAHHLFPLPLNFFPFFKPTSWPLLERTKYNEIIARLKLKRFYCDIGRFPIRGKRGGTVGRRHLLILTYLEPLVIRMKKKRKKKKWIARSRRKLISTRLCIYAQSQLWWWWWWILASCRRYEKGGGRWRRRRRGRVWSHQMPSNIAQFTVELSSQMERWSYPLW